MLRIGLTGGMGCGKSTIAHIFSALEIPVYNADLNAKRLSESPRIKTRIAQLFGKQAAADKKKLAEIVFARPEELTRLNALVHPLVFADMENWFKTWANAPLPPPYAVVETAILFECGMEHTLDYVIDVEAPLETQIARCSSRDNSSRQEVLARLSRQLSAQERMEKSHFVVQNGNHDRVLPLILEIDVFLRRKAASPYPQGI